MAAEFTLRFDGLIADHHRLDMRQLGRSLIGTETIIHRALWVAAYPGRPQGRKRLDLTVEVEAPKAACLEIQGALTAVGGLIPFANDIAANLGSDYVKAILSALILQHGGRTTEADKHLNRALDIITHQIDVSARDRQLERHMIERMHTTSVEALVSVINAGQQQAREIVAPVGPSADKLRIGGATLDDATEIDVAVADAVRSSEKLTVSDMETISIRLDALVRHSRSAKVELPDDPGRYYPAEIRDPSYDTFPNAYTDAFGAGSTLTVAAKLSRRETGELVRMHILDIAK